MVLKLNASPLSPNVCCMMFVCQQALYLPCLWGSVPILPSVPLDSQISTDPSLQTGRREALELTGHNFIQAVLPLWLAFFC